MEDSSVNLIVKTTVLVMDIVSSYLKKGDFAVDCTMGNGNDTLSLVQLTGAADVDDGLPHVYAFDIQEAALQKTSVLLADKGVQNPAKHGIRLIRDSHEKLEEYIAEAGRQPSAILFNLGFMPGQDKSVLTTAATSMPAIQAALSAIREDGIVSVVTYCGHPEGREEHEKLLTYLESLPPKKYHVAFFNMINQKKTAPSVFFITKKKRVSKK